MDMYNEEDEIFCMDAFYDWWNKSHFRNFESFYRNMAEQAWKRAIEMYLEKHFSDCVERDID